MKLIPWRNDWEQFRRLFKASARLNGVSDAVKAGEAMATIRSRLAKAKVSSEVSPNDEQKVTEKQADPEISNEARKQAPKLAAMLTLTLMDTEGVQQSIITDELEDDEDGIAAWAALTMHFEYSTEDLRAEALYHAWEEETLNSGEHPDVLWARLASIQRKLLKLNEDCSDKSLVRKFISAIQKSPNNQYESIIASYKGQLVMGKPYTALQLRELLGMTYKESKENRKEENAGMKGFLTISKCDHCKKQGHNIKECWTKDPSKRNQNKQRQKGSNHKGKQEITCWGCNKPGHYEKQCWVKHPELKQDRAVKTGIAAATLSSYPTEPKPIYLDSACSCHLMASLDFSDKHTLHRATTTLTAVGGQRINMIYKGATRIQTADGPMTLSDAYYAEGLDYSLLSAPQLVKQVVRVCLDEDRAYIQKGKGKINLTNKDGLWALPPKPQNKIAALRMQRGNKANATTWHQRLGHISTKKMKEMADLNMIPKQAIHHETNQCTICNLTKPIRRPVPHEAERSGETTVQIDYMPVGAAEKGWRGQVGAYVFSLRESKIVKAYAVNDAGKENALQSLRSYLKDVLPYVAEKVTCVQTDAGSQFTSQAWEDECKIKGLKYRNCPIDHQAMNGQVERVIGIIASIARAMLRDHNTPTIYWPLALDAATYLFNRTTHSALQGLTPLQQATGKEPDLTRTRVFGCKAHVQIPKKHRRGKFQNTAWSGAMVGYSTNSPEWIIMDPRTNILRKAYSVTFNEMESGFKNDKQVKNKEILLWSELGTCNADGEQNAECDPANDGCAHYTNDPEREGSANEQQKVQADKNKQIFTRENDNEGIDPNESEYSTSGRKDIRVQEDQLQHLGMCMALKTNDKLPRTWKQAMQEPHWLAAMEKEVEELKAKDAWVLVERTEEMRVLPGVWAFRIKKDENGNVVKYKARWCVNGSSDKFNWTSEVIYSPVAEISTVRILFAIAAAKGQEVLQADFPNAYLNAEMDEDVYINQPYGIYDYKNKDKVCLLKKALYGSAISGKKWHENVTKQIRTLGYERSVIDHCLFIRNTGNNIDLLVIYVDDVLVTSTAGVKQAEKQLDELENSYDIKRLGKASHMLGMGVHQNENGIVLEQQAYLESILDELGYADAKPRGTPWNAYQTNNENELDSTWTTLYRRAVGQLMYLANVTRPDVSFTVNRLASNMQAPNEGDWERVKRVLKYLRGTKDMSIIYNKQHGRAKPMELKTYAVASFAADKRKGRSITGYVIHLENSPIYWASRLQKTVADSPNTAEYIALYEASVATVSIKNLINEMGSTTTIPSIYEDNDGARRLAMAGMGQKKARHLMTKHHYVQELCQEGEIKIERIPTSEQPADLLTKGSHTIAIFNYLRDKLRMVINSNGDQ